MLHRQLYSHDQKLILVVIVILCLAVAMPHCYYGTGMAGDDVLWEIRSIHSIIHLHVLHLVSSITPVLVKIVTRHIYVIRSLESKLQIGYISLVGIFSRFRVTDKKLKFSRSLVRNRRSISVRRAGHDRLVGNGGTCSCAYDYRWTTQTTRATVSRYEVHAVFWR